MSETIAPSKPDIADELLAERRATDPAQLPNHPTPLTLHPQEQAWLDQYRQALTKQYPDTIDRLLIFGSKARGDAHEDSDVDVLLLVKESHSHLQIVLRDLGYDLATEVSIVPSILAYTSSQWESGKRGGYPFHTEVERDAVTVYQHQTAPPINHHTTYPMNNQVIPGYWQRAQKALKSSDYLLQNGLYEDSVSRAYYAIFHCAVTALLVHGIITKTHSGLRHMFSKHLIKTGDIEPKWLKCLTHHSAYRESADYSIIRHFGIEEATNANTQAHQFASRIKKYLLTKNITELELNKPINPST